MRNFYTITQDEFETAARFLQVVATLQHRKHEYYSELLDEERRWNSRMGGEDYRRIESWLNDIIPNFHHQDAEHQGGATVYWDGNHLLVYDEGRVLAAFDPAELRNPGSDGFHGKLRGMGVSTGKPERLRELRGAGALGRVLYLISSRDNEYRAEDIKEARKLVLGILQEACIRVEVITGDGALNEDHIVWGDYSEPCKAIERQEALENQRVTSLSIPAVRSWFHKPKPEPEHEVPESETEPETAPARKRHNLWGWALVAFELLVIGWICYIYATQGPYSSELAVACAVGALTSPVGIAVLRSTDERDE